MSSNFILQLYRGSAAQNDTYTGKAGELTIDTSHRRIRIHDGVTQGGHPLASLSEILNPTQIQNLVDSEVAGLESSVLTQLSDKASLSGSSLQDFNTDTLYVRKILPSESAVDIGDVSNRFRAIYVDEAHLSTNTLYIGDTPIMGTDQDTVIIRTDPNQSLSLITSGSGSLSVQSQRNVTVSTDGMNADVHLNAYGVGSNVRLGAMEDIVFTAKNIRANASLDVRGDVDIRDDLVVGGNLSVKGQTFEVDTERVRATDNMMVLNYGEEGSGVTVQYAGIEIDRGNMSSYQFVFDEVDDLFKVGTVGDLEPVATRDWVDGLYSVKDHEHDSATTTVSGFMSAEDKTKLNGIESGATADQTKADIDALGIDAATVNGRGVESNVPSNALFTDTVYDDSSVLASLGDLETGKVDRVTGKGLSANDFTDTLKNKLDGIESGAEKNVDTNLSVGGSGNSRTLVSSTGSNANLPLASSANAGLMSTGDKSKLTGIDAGAEVNSVNSVAGKTGNVSLVKGDVGLGSVDNTSDANKPVSTAQQSALDAKVDISDIVNSLTINASDKPLSAAQGRALKIHIDNINAVLQSDDATLDELQEIVDYIKANRSELESLSVSNIAGLQNALDGKVDAVSGKGLSSNDYTGAEKNKLAGIEAGAQANVGDTFNASGNYAGLRARGTTKADVGLESVRNVTSYSQSEADVRFLPKGTVDMGTLP